MAIIYSYPLSTPKLDDLLIGTSVYDENATVPVIGNPTVSFTLRDIVGMIAPVIGLQDLQSVTTVGNTTTNPVIINNSLSVLTTIKDSSGSVGSVGQVLSSTVTGTSWTTNVVSNNYFVTGAAFDTSAGVLTITGNNAAVGATVNLDGRYLIGNQTITLSGDVSGSGATTITTTLATVNSNVGAFTNANITVNAKGLITAASSGSSGGTITGSGADTQITIWDSATSITGNSNYTRDASNNISQGADTDVKNTIGRAVVDGGTINSDFAIFTHIDRVGSLDYAFMVSPNGSSYINAAGAGQTVQILDDNSSVANFSNGLIQLGATNVQLSQYGSGTVTGTPTYNLSVDSTGKIIETANSSGGSGITVANITVTASQLIALAVGATETPVTLIAAPGAGKGFNIQQVYGYLDAGSDAFNFSGGTVAIQGYAQYGTGMNLPLSGFINETNDILENLTNGNGFNGDNPTANTSMILRCTPNGGATTGNGTLYISIAYKIIDIGPSIQAGF
tara:strand:- start:11 stop:1531 length:1521 start_codon:yes stop_codon:yes gene_type:complete